jgi:hypothetical protein
MNIFAQVIQKFTKKPKLESNIQIQTFYPCGYSRSSETRKARDTVIREIIKGRKAHDCIGCGAHIFAGSFICRVIHETLYFSYDYLCLECAAKKYKRLNNQIAKNFNEYQKNNILAKLRAKEE